jgi:inositol oxygenase
MGSTRHELLKTGAITLIATTSGAAAALNAAQPPADSPGGRGDAERFTAGRGEYERDAAAIYVRHWQQTRETVAALKRKYEDAVYGRVDIWDLVPKLAFCVDPTDRTLYCTTQLIHTQQVVAGMEADGLQDPDIYLAAVLHDLGKVLLLQAEAPENVVCANTPIGVYTEGIGLDNVIFQWNHDEFIYSRVKDYVPDHVAWLVRYHSIRSKPSIGLMDARDRSYHEAYLKPFHHYDLGTKSVCFLPPQDVLDRYRDLVSQYFPKPILI